MNLDDIRTILAVYEYRSFTEAAYLTFQSLSAVSKCISRAEKELGGQLFVRSRSGLKITPLGDKVFPLLYEMQDASIRTVQAGRSLLSAADHSNSISVGYTPLLGTVGENEILLRLRMKDQSVRIRQVKRFGNVLQQLVSDSKIDAAFLFYISNTDMSDIWRNMNDCLGLVKIMQREGTYIAMSSDHPLADRDEVHISEFKDDVFIFNVAPQHYDVLGGYTRYIFNTPERNIPPERIKRMDFINRSMLIDAIRSGSGVCPVACEPPVEKIDGIKFVKDADSKVHSVGYLCWNSDNINPNVEEIIEIAIDYAKERGIAQ